MKTLKHFMLPEQTNQLYKKEAASSIALTRDVAGKINELVDAYNELSKGNLAKEQEQDGRIRKAVLYMKDNLINSIHDLLSLLKENGEFDSIVTDAVLHDLNALMLRNESVISVKEYGARGDGITDDSYAIQKALDSVTPTKSIVYFPCGTYLTNNDLMIRSNTHLMGCGEKSIIKRKGNKLTNYAVLNCAAEENIIIENIKVLGERKDHLSESGEWGMCISLSGAKNVNIKNCHLADAWGDGIYVGSHNGEKCEHITVQSCMIDNNRRNGVSVINCDVFRMVNCIITNTKGTAPQSGIDFEPNNEAESCKNCVVENCYFSGNANSDIMTHGTFLFEVMISNCSLNSKIGFDISNGGDLSEKRSDGYISLKNCTFNNSHRCISGYKNSLDSPLIVSDCDFFCDSICVEIGSSSFSSHYNLGNISFHNCHLLKATGQPPMRFIHKGDGMTFENVFIDCVISPGVSKYIYVDAKETPSIYLNINNAKTTITDSNISMNKYALYNEIDMHPVTSHRSLTLANNIPFGFPITIRNTSGYYDLNVILSDATFPQLDDAASITLSDRFETVTIVHEQDGYWSIKKYI